MQRLMRNGVPLVVSAPSGGGKTTLCRRLIAEVPDVDFSISHTTRLPRGRERSGVDYHFVVAGEFDRLVATGAFLEWAQVHGQRYGTSRRDAEVRLCHGVDVLFDIDIQGGRQIAQQLMGTVLVFVVPPDLATLEQRLRGRGSDSADEIERRLKVAQSEIAGAGFYDYWIVNDNLEIAFGQLRSILFAERLRRADHEILVDDLLGRRR